MKCFLFPYWVQKNNLFWDNETKQKPLYLLIPPTSKKLTPVYVHQIQFWVGTLPSIMRVLVAVSVWGKTSCSYHKENKMSWKQFKFLNGQLTNHRWGRALDLGGRYCFDQWLKSKSEIDSDITIPHRTLTGSFKCICSFITVSLFWCGQSL